MPVVFRLTIWKRVQGALCSSVSSLFHDYFADNPYVDCVVKSLSKSKN